MPLILSLIDVNPHGEGQLPCPALGEFDLEAIGEPDEARNLQIVTERLTIQGDSCVIRQGLHDNPHLFPRREPRRPIERAHPADPALRRLTKPGFAESNRMDVGHG